MGSLLVFAAGVNAKSITVDPGQDIQSVIDAAEPGDVVVLKAGVHELTETLSGKSGVTVVGEAHGGTILRACAPLGTLMDLANNSDVRLAHLVLDGQGNKAAFGVTASHCSRLTLEHLVIRDLNQPGHDPIGIHFSRQVTHSTVRHNKLDQIGVHSFWGAGIRLAHGSSRNLVEENTIRNVGRGGILVNDGSTHVLIRSNRISHMGLNNPTRPGDPSEVSPRLGIELWNQCHDSLIERNTLDHYISIDSSSRIAVRENLLRRVEGSTTRAFAGIEIVGGTIGGPARDLIIIGNRLVATPPDLPAVDLGISISGSGEVSHVLFDRNRIEGAGTWALQIQASDQVSPQVSKHRLYFLENHFTQTRDGQPGPYARHGPHGQALRINTDHAPIHHVIFERNTIENNRGVALHILDAKKVDHLRFTANTVENNGPGGARLTDFGQPHRPAATLLTHGSDKQLELSVEFNDRRPVAHTLWDVGQGLPRLGQRIEAGDLAQGQIHSITVVAWDLQGHAIHVRKALRLP